MTQATGQGFVDVGWIGCLKQSPSEAQESLDGLKKELAAKGVEILKPVSHDEMRLFVKESDPFTVVMKFGPPSEAKFVPKDDQGNTSKVIKNYGTVKMETTQMSEYSTSPKAPVEQRDPEQLKDIQGKIASKADGLYWFMWKKPLTYGLLGLEDDYMSYSFTFKGGKLADSSLSHPKHLWQAWF